MTERWTGWQCIGCGRIEAPQNCIGVCQDRKAEFVRAEDYDETLAELERARRQLDVLNAVARQIAFTHPRDGEWESAYRALQARARAALAGAGA
ncbi:MAG: hypothetical protein ACOZDY_06935 [Pseudomonadota bacterium]